MTFSITIGKYGGFYFRRDYTTRLCLGWVAFTFYPFDFDDLHNKQEDRVRSLMECYHEAISDAARYHAVLTDIQTGAAQQSQSHADVLCKCRAALGE